MLTQILEGFTVIASQTKTNLGFLTGIFLVLWGCYLINLTLGNALLYLGIRPRKALGLSGIFFAPFLHANFNHLFFNTIPLLVLANFILIQGVPLFLHVSALIILLSGLLIWCFAPDGLYIGASGVITGYWGYLLAHAYYQSTATTLILAVVCAYYFMGIFYSIFPEKKHIAWQGHLFGLLSGLGIAYYF